MKKMFQGVVSRVPTVSLCVDEIKLFIILDQIINTYDWK